MEAGSERHWEIMLALLLLLLLLSFVVGSENWKKRLRMNISFLTGLVLAFVTFCCHASCANMLRGIRRNVK
jgi:hypothetical protein